MSFDAISTIFTTITTAFFYNFSQDIKDSIENLIEAQLEVYDNVLNGPMKPTPSKSHYTFNLRDISKIFQGVVSANSRLTQQPVQLVRLWIHENKRVFGDRLIDDKDRSFLDDMLLDRAQVKFALAKKEIFNAERIIFGDFMDGIDVENRVYR
jgi:dynein heavy chain